MVRHIHILGASGAGTTTLAKALTKKFGMGHFDTDYYYWEPSPEPFTIARKVSDRLAMMDIDLNSEEKWVLSGSLCGWGDSLIPLFDLVVFLWIPEDVRISRLVARERERYGAEMDPGGRRHEASKEFIEWASRYDSGGMDVRSLMLHNVWLSRLPCPVLRIEGDMALEESMKIVEDKICKLSG